MHVSKQRQQQTNSPPNKTNTKILVKKFSRKSLNDIIRPSRINGTFPNVDDNFEFNLFDDTTCYKTIRLRYMELPFCES